MSTLKVNTIQDTTGDNALTFDSSGNTTVAQSLTVTGKINSVNGNGYPSAGGFSHRNLIINGDMQVAQRGTSSTTMGVSTVDRWRYGWSGQDEAQTLAQVALTSSDTGPWAKGFRHCLQMTNGNQSSGAGTTDQSYIEQRIEAQNIATSGWDYTSSSSYLTLSFWVKSSVAQTFYFQAEMWDGTSQLYVGSYSLSANTWTKVTKTIPGNSNVQVDTNNDKGMSITFWQFYGTNNTDNSRSLDWAAFGSPYTPDQTSTWWTTNDATFALTGVQLEVGETATEYEHLSYGDQLNRCLRYYYRVTKDDTGDIGVSPGWARDDDQCHGNINFPVPMRKEPTALVTSGDATDYAFAYKTTAVVGQDVPSHDSATPYSASISFHIQGTPLTAGECGRIQGQTSDAFFAWDLEY